MSATTTTDVIIPEILKTESQVLFAKQFDFTFQGTAVRDPNVGPGELVNLRGFSELTGDANDLVSGGSYGMNSIGTQKDVMPILHKIKKWGAEDLAKILSGMDPTAEIARQQANYWNKEVMNRFINVLEALFNSSTGILHETNRYAPYVDTGTEGSQFHLTPAVAAAGMGKLGDNFDDLGVWFMHSATKAYLLGQGYLETLTNPKTYGTSPTGAIQTFMGKPIVSCDSCTVTAGSSAGSYRTYLAAAGSLYLGIQKDINPEISRDSNKLDVISTDFHFGVGVRGVYWNTSALTNNATANTTLALPASWSLSAADEKFVRIIAIDHNI